MADPEERYRLAAEALELAQAAEKKALREFNDARHDLIEARSRAYETRAAPAGLLPGPCPSCGRATKVIKDERYHLDPLAGLRCGAARVRWTRETLR